MSVIGLISCVGRKRANPTDARNLYDSPLFTKSREYVEHHCDKWFILSAKYGLVSPDQVIDPYEETLNAKSGAERKLWAGGVWKQLALHLGPDDRLIILAGASYREFLVPMIQEHGCHVEVPMEGKGIGRQLQWLSQQLPPPTKEAAT